MVSINDATNLRSNFHRALELCLALLMKQVDVICASLIVVYDWDQVAQIQYESDGNNVKDAHYALGMAYEQYKVFNVKMELPVTNSVLFKGKMDY